MRRYYITDFIESDLGIKDVGIQIYPSIAKYGGSWGIISLKPDITKLEGIAVGYVDTESVVRDSGVKLLTDDLGDKALSTKRLFNSQSGLSLESQRLPDLLAELLIYPQRPRFCKPIKRCCDGKYRIKLGGLIWGEPFPVYRKRSISDNFNRATLGADWTVVSGTWNIYNSVEVQNEGAYNWINTLRYDASALGSDDHYAELDFTYASGSTRFVCTMVRSASDADTHYRALTRESGGLRSIEEITNRGASTLTSDTGGTAPPHTVKLEVDGSDLTFYEDDVEVLSTTDSTLIGNVHVGISGRAATARGDNFLADVLVPVTFVPKIIGVI